ncbi:MAG TPA: methyl-accepting chemotaxis protein, partial [Paraburkholderia sp.]
MKAVSQGGRHAGFVPQDPASGATLAQPRRTGTRNSRLSVKATLRLAFALVLVGTLAIGAVSLTQISRLNGSAQSIYEQGYVA